MDPYNGLIFAEKYVPEVLQLIFTYVPPKKLLNCSLVCKNWNRIIKGRRMWMQMFKRKFPNRTPKRLPWFVYYVMFTTKFFDTNLVNNPTGRYDFNGWTVTKHFREGFVVEDPPCGCPGLPRDVADFERFNGCFATSCHCRKSQNISLATKKVHRAILRRFKPHILVSDWTCPRYDHRSYYILTAKVVCFKSEIVEYVRKLRWKGSAPENWTKVEILIEDYPDDIKQLRFVHENIERGEQTGRNGCKMAGAVVKILFDSIKDDT